MAVLSDYVTGTISLTNGSVNFTGVGTGWESAEFKEGDTIIDITGATEYMGVVATISGEASGTLTKAWEGPTLVNVPYRLRYQPDGTRATAQARQLIELLGNGNLTSLASLTGSANKIPMFTGPGAMTLVAKTDLVSGANYDVQVANLSARATYNGQDTGFAVLVSDIGDGRAAIYSKNSATSGDWSNAAIVTGPVGPTVTFEAGDTTTLPSGSDATVEVVPVTGGYELNIGVPRGLQGIPGNDGPTGNGLEIDATGNLAGRDAYDSEAEGFTYLDTVNGDLYFRETGVSGTWSPAVPFVGPAGADGATITTTEGVGDGTAGPYTLDAAPAGLDNILSVSISGVEQYDYSVVSDQITFGQAVDVGVPWQVKASGSLAIGTPAAGTIVSASITNDSLEQGLIRSKLGANSGGNCQLVLSGANLLLQPLNGNTIIIDGAQVSVPSSGVTLTPTGATPNTLYYIYAYLNAGILSLERSITGHERNTTTGIQQKIGDSSRSMVGWAVPITGPTWVNNSTHQYVRSWFNDKGLFGTNALMSDVNHSINDWVELSNSSRVHFISRGECINFGVVGIAGCATASGKLYGTSVGIDGVTPQDGPFVDGSPVVSSGLNWTAIGATWPAFVEEGIHYATILGRSYDAESVMWKGAGGSTSARCVLNVTSNFGNAGTKVEPIRVRGTIRSVSGTWELLTTDNHRPEGVASISQTSTSIIITYSETGSNVIKASVSLDDTFATTSLIDKVGPSVGLSSTGIMLGKIDGSGNTSIVNPSTISSAGGNIWFDIELDR